MLTAAWCHTAFNIPAHAMSLKEAAAVLGTIAAIAGNVPYLLDVLRNRAQPHPYTWLAWTIVSAITFFGQLMKGGGIGAIPTAAAEIFTAVIFVVSLQYGFARVEKRDNYYLAAALAGIVPWIITRDPTISVVIAVAIDLVAFTPTLRKTWYRPDTETPLLYGMNVTRHLLTLYALGAYNVATTLHSFAMIVTNVLMTGMILMRRNRAY